MSRLRAEIVLPIIESTAMRQWNFAMDVQERPVRKAMKAGMTLLARASSVRQLAQP